MRSGPSQQRDEDGSPAGRRDRDEAGRPLNARPRDSLGRPLARGAAGEPAGRQPAALGSAAAIEVAQQLLDEGRPFHAHEVLEDAWRAAPPDERDLWQGLAQLAVGLTHALRGNSRGAVALLRRGADLVGGYASSSPHGIDAAGVALAAQGMAARIERTGLAGMAAAELRLRLRTGPGSSAAGDPDG